ncbi:MAG: hypothetical protein WA919_24500 [Coleofasciculaceae cyanobacterium]
MGESSSVQKIETAAALDIKATDANNSLDTHATFWWTRIAPVHHQEATTAIGHVDFCQIGTECVILSSCCKSIVHGKSRLNSE